MNWLEFALTAVFSAGAGAIIVKLLNRGVDVATAAKIRADSKKVAVETAEREVEIVRGLLDEFRLADAKKTATIEDLKARLDKLEERERHMLTRAAVHEAWDQMAFAFIVGHDANFPQPPPLSHEPRAIARTEETDQHEEHS